MRTNWIYEEIKYWRVVETGIAEIGFCKKQELRNENFQNGQLRKRELRKVI